MTEMDPDLDYVLVPNNTSGYTKTPRATAQAAGVDFVELPANGEADPRQMVNPVYDSDKGRWADSVATVAALNGIEKQLTLNGQDIVGQAAMALQALALAVASKTLTTPINDWATRIKAYRDLPGMGGWTDGQVESAVTVNWITADDYAAITGKSYLAPVVPTPQV